MSDGVVTVVFKWPIDSIAMKAISMMAEEEPNTNGESRAVINADIVAEVMAAVTM